MTFLIGDIVKLNNDYSLRIVSGVIHDSERLFVTGIYGGEEAEVSFNVVESRWSKKDL